MKKRYVIFLPVILLLVNIASGSPSDTIRIGNHSALEAERHFNEGIKLFNQNQPTLALEQFTKAANIYPEYAQAFYNRGVVKQSQFDFEEAFADFNKAI